MNKKIKIAAIQMDCELNNSITNLETAENFIIQAAQNGAKLIVLPEFFATGYRVEENDYALAERIPGPITDRVCEISKKLGVFVVGNMIEKSELDDVLYDTSFIANGELLGKYRKIFLWQTEHLRFKSGDDYPVFDLGFASIGMQICYEVGFPESARLLALGGAQIIVYSAAFGSGRAYVWDLATRARALENGVYVIAVGRIGQEKDDLPFAGWSRIVNPKGQIIAEASTYKEEIIYAEIDLSEVETQRFTIPYLRDLDPAFLGKNYSRFNK